jgi:hypothetical protein
MYINCPLYSYLLLQFMRSHLNPVMEEYDAACKLIERMLVREGRLVFHAL